MAANVKLNYLIVFICITFLSAFSLHAADPKNGLSQGQLIYVPAYSHIYIGNKEAPFLLAVTLSIRNVDPNKPIEVTMVDYYATQGKLLKQFTDTPIQVKPLETLRYVIPERDKSGGSGANFIVRWQSDGLVNPPIVETIMVSTSYHQGISFTSRGQEILPSK